MFCRALTVLGGVAAGTALAWWLSSTSASAETEVPVDAPAVVQHEVQQVVAPVEHTVDAATQRLQDPPPAPKVPLVDLGQKVKDAAKQFQPRADLPKLPPCGNLCPHNERHLYPVDGFSRMDLPGMPALAPAATTVAPGVAVDALTPNTAKDRAFADGMSRRGSPAPARPADPGLPNWPAPLPFVPAGVPTAGNHGSAGNADDSHLLAALPWQDRADDQLVADGIAAAYDAATAGRPTAQPGVLPD
jgi:hypothetical protein